MLLERLNERPSSKTAKIFLLLGFILCIVITPIMQYFSTLSGFPANFISSQLSFSGEIMKSHYSVTNIEIYRISPILDYIFMLGYGLVLFSGSILVARKYNPSTRLNKIGYIISIFGIIAAICDGIENIFILTMLMEPLTFPNILAIIHSIFALIKWIIIFISIPWIIGTRLMCLITSKNK